MKLLEVLLELFKGNKTAMVLLVLLALAVTLITGLQARQAFMADQFQSWQTQKLNTIERKSDSTAVEVMRQLNQIADRGRQRDSVLMSYRLSDSLAAMLWRDHEKRITKLEESR